MRRPLRAMAILLSYIPESARARARDGRRMGNAVTRAIIEYIKEFNNLIQLGANLLTLRV